MCNNYFFLFYLLFTFLNAQNDYTYDANGNLTSDANRGIEKIEYVMCHENMKTFYLPGKILFKNGDYAEYLYDATGNKLQKKVFKEGKLIKTVDYLDGYVYVNSELKYKNHPEGFIKYDRDANGNQKMVYVYHFLDHQNNVRLLYADVNKDGKVSQDEILAEYNYYPFGLRHEGYNNVEHELLANSEYKDGYQQQELDDDLGLGWYGFKYRNYDPHIARFTTIDPLAEEYAYNSPYNFQENKLGMGVELEGLEMVPNFSAQHDVYQQLKTSSSAKEAQNRINQMNKATGVYSQELFKQGSRYLTPVEDVYGVATGQDFDGNQYNRVEAGGWAIASLVPFSKVGKLGKLGKGTLKYSDNVSSLVQATGKLSENSKEIVTVLNKGSRNTENAINVAKDIIGDLGDDVVEYSGKFGNQKGKVTGFSSSKGNKGFRVDWDSKKGGHINWWNGKQKGAVLFDAGETQVNQIIENEVIKSFK